MADTIEIVVRAKDEFSATLGNFGNILTGIKSAIDLVSSGFQAFAGFAMEGLDAIAGYERMSLSIQSLVASQMMMNGAATDMASAMQVAGIQAEGLLKWIQELAIKSPFTQDGVAQAFRMAMAYGFNAEEAKRLTEANINFVSATGQTEYAMERIARALGQISATGKLTGQDMMQLTQVGVPVLQILADYFGTTTQKVIEMRSQGLIPAKDAIEAITLWMENNFSGAAEAFTKSWAGLLSTFSDLKEIGLREFFGGLAEAIQPVAVAFSNWMQGPGMEALRNFGAWLAAPLEPLKNLFTAINDIQAISSDIPFLSALGVALMHMQDVSPVINRIGEDFLIMQGQINTGLPPMMALANFFNNIATSEAGTKIGDIALKIRDFINDILTSENLGETLSGYFAEVTDAIGLKVSELINKFIVIVGNSDFTPIGRAISIMLTGVFSGLDAIISNVDWKPAGVALQSALGELWAGLTAEGIWKPFFSALVGDVYFQHSSQEIVAVMLSIMLETLRNNPVDRFFDSAKEIGLSILEGIKAGFMKGMDTITEWIGVQVDDFVQDWKDFLGIASPSTVFMGIGINIVQGLMLGIASMWSILSMFVSTLVGTLVNTFKTLVSTLMDIFSGVVTAYRTSGLAGVIEYVKDLLTGSSTASTSSTGSIGGYSPNTNDTRSGITGQANVVNNFYGPVYFGNLEPVGYDCPSPHPLVAASGNSLLTSSIG